jgi:demethylmenaquinone methyltransferase/2-methoxy-6-polyprenyl-1,4-benzoquinol methylase
VSNLLQSQLEYYRARANEYDEWFLRRGRYDRGPELNNRWFSEIAELRDWLASRGDLGDVLELAAGTGLWTEPLVRQSRSIHCIDAAPETLDVNRTRLGRQQDRITYEVADIFQWRPSRRFNTVFFGFWHSHVPDEQFVAFWKLVDEALSAGGQALIVDSLADPTSTALDHTIERGGEVTRRLNDGRQFRIVKRFWEPTTLVDRLTAMGWEVSLQTTANYFLYARLTRA